MIVNSYGEGIQLDVPGNTTAGDCGIVIERCELNITSKDFAGSYVSVVGSDGFADVIIRNKANVTVKSNAEDSDDWAHIGIYGNNDVIISDSTVKVESVGATNAIFSENGKVSITDSDVEAKNLSVDAGPAIYGTNGVEISNSEVTAVSYGDSAIFSYYASLEIKENSVVTANGNRSAIRGYTGLNIANSEITANSVSEEGFYADYNYLTIQDSIIKATTGGEWGTISCGQAVANPPNKKFMG